ncbi:MAG: ABC transporter permease [Phycisphaerales bacterium]
MRTADGQAPSLLWTLARHRSLLWELTRREVGERFAGSLLGRAWVVAHPVFLMVLYVVVFGWIFPSRMPDQHGNSPRAYAVYILSGLLPWLTCVDLLNRAPMAIRGNAALVKQIVFPVEVLPVRTTLALLPTQLLLLALLLAYMLLGAGTGVPATVLLVAPLMVLQVAFLSGLCAGISAVSVAARDVRELLQLFTTAGLFLVPVLYSPTLFESFPAILQWVVKLNPFSHLVWCFQDSLWFGSIQHPWSWVVVLVLAPVSWALGARIFWLLRPLFGDRL